MWIQFHGSKHRKENFRRSWELIPVPDMVIARVNVLGGEQPKQLTFKYIHGCLIGYVKIPGMGADSDKEEVKLP